MQLFPKISSSKLDNVGKVDKVWEHVNMATRHHAGTLST